MADWIVAVFTALSVIGAGFSWWKANASRDARIKSEAAAKHAEESLAEVRRQTLALEQLAAAARPDPLVIEGTSGDRRLLRNTTGQEIAIEDLVNRQEFGSRVFELLPVVIQPNGAEHVTILELESFAVPATMELRVRGREDVVRVRIPRG